LNALGEDLAFLARLGAPFPHRLCCASREAQKNPGRRHPRTRRKSSMTCEQMIDYTLFELDKVFAEAAVP
jgi:hypothetical protein